MSTESLTLHFSDETLLVRPRASLESVCAPFLAEEAYPRILGALLDTQLGDGEERIILSEENIAAVASAASGALFGEDDVFARFLVVPRVESAISVLLWRVRINSTCAGTITEGQTGIQLPSVPVRVLASSLAGLLDNTKLYASSKQVAFPAPHTPLQKHEPRLDHHHLAPPTPVTATGRTHSDPCLSPSALARPPPPRLSFSRPMTPPDSAVVETTPISASDASTDTFLTPTTPTSKRTGLPRVKFRPPPIITRTTPSRPVPRLTQSAGAVTLTFAAAALSGCEIEPLSYVPKTKEQPTTDNVVEPDKEDEKAPDDDDEDPPPSPPPTAKPKLARPPSPKPRAPSPTKRVLRKAPPTPKSRPRSIVRAPSPTKQSMWAPAGAEAHYRSPSPTKLAPPVRTRSMLGAGSRTGSMESSPALPPSIDLPSSSSSPALLPKSKLRAPSPAPRTPSPAPPPAVFADDAPSPSPSQSMPGSSLRSPSSNLLRSPGSSMFNGSSVGFGSPAGSVLDVKDKTPATPTARRTVSVSGVKFEVIESPSPSRHPSWPVHQPTTPSRTPPAQDTLSPSPNALRTRLGASPGATSLSTVPSLSPFPDSDSDVEFGVKKGEEEDVTVTSKIRGLGLTRTVTPPTRASTSTPTRKSPPPINTNTSSPSRNSKRSYTLGVPMTQLSSHPPTIHNASESEAESLAFPGSTSTLSLPGDISLPELVSPFTTPLELGPSSSSGGEGDGSPTRAGFGRREPLPLPRVTSVVGPGSGSGVGAGSVSAVGPGSVSAVGADSRLGSSFVSEPLSASVLASVIKSRSGSVPPTHSRSSSIQHQQPRPAPSRSGSVPPSHSRSGSTHEPRPTHSRSGSQAQIRLGGRESEMDLLVPFAVTRALSQTDVLRLMNKSGSSASTSGSESPNRTSVVGGPPVPVFMAPGSVLPSQVGKRMSLVKSPPSTSSESTNPSPLLSNQAPAVEALSHSRIPSETSVDDTDDTEDDYIVRTAEVEVGAGRARVQSGVGIGGGRARGGKKSKTKIDKEKTDGALARSASAATARPRVDSVRTRTESAVRTRFDSVTRARVDSTARPRVESVTRPRVESVMRPRADSNVRARVDSGLRRKSGADDSPASPTRSPSSASAGRVVGRRPSGEVLGRRTPIGRKASAASMRKSSTSSLRSTATNTTRTTPMTVSTKKTSVSSVSRTSTPQSGTSTPRSRSMSTGAKENGTGIATPKQAGTPRPSISTPRTSMSSGRNIASPRPSVTIPRPSATSPKSSPRTPVTPANKTPVARVPPARPQRSSLRPGPRSNTLSTSAPAVTQTPVTPVSYTSTEFDPTPLTAPAVSAPSLPSATSPPRTRATSLDTSPKAQLGADDARPRRVTSISSKPPPLSRSSVSVASTLAPPPVPPPIRARASSRTTSSTGHEDGAVPFPIPESASESEGGLKVPDTPRGPKRSLSVSSAARRFVNRARGASPVPSMPTPATDNVSLASSVEKTPAQEKTPKSGRSLSRLAFSALLPKRNANNAAAEAKAALAQAKAREVAEAKARAKVAAEEAKARAKAEAEAKAAAKEPRKLARRFGSMSKKTSVAS